MRLTRLVATDFLAYEALDLDLTGVSSVVVTGPNGAGKSALLDGLTWCLFGTIGRDITSKDLVIRDGADATAVIVELTWQGHEVQVRREKQRGRTGTLGLWIDHQSGTRHTIAETEAAIADMLGLSYAALMAGPIMAQETASAFMRSRPADRKDLLADLFGLDRYDAYWRAATEQGRAAKSKLDEADNRLAEARDTIEDDDGIEAAVDHARQQRAANEEAQSLANARIIAAREHIAAAEARTSQVERLRAERGRLISRSEAAEREQVTLRGRVAEAEQLAGREDIGVDQQSLRDAEAAYQAAQGLVAQRERLTVDLARAEQIEAERRQARERLAAVPCHGEGIYASCPLLRAVPTEAMVAEAVTHVTDLRLALADAGEPDTRPLYDNLIRLRAADDQGRQVALTVARATAVLDDGRARLTALADGLAGIRSDLDRVNAELAEVEADVTGLASWRDELASAEMAYASTRAAADRWTQEVRAGEIALARLIAARETVATWEPRRAEAAQLVDSLTLLARAFHRDGIPTRILEHGIPLIEAEANRVLATLPGSLSVALRTQRAKATGGMADTLDVVVTVDGWEREYGLLSVGMRFRVDLALRLGLARVLTHRSGATIDTLWLDEPLAALDAEGREAVMETLAALEDQFDLIVVVSHHADFNDRFGARVEVEQQDGISTARLVA